jgi:hypothetical protein
MEEITAAEFVYLVSEVIATLRRQMDGRIPVRAVPEAKAKPYPTRSRTVERDLHKVGRVRMLRQKMPEFIFDAIQNKSDQRRDISRL